MSEKKPFFERAAAFFVGAWESFRELFTKIDEWVDTVGRDVVLFVEGLNKAIQSGTVSGDALDYLVSLIPGTIDDQVLEFLRLKLPEVLEQLDYFVDDENPHPGGLTGQFIEDLQSASSARRQALLFKTASLLSSRLITQVDVTTPKAYETDTLVSISFSKLKKEGLV